MLVRGPSNLSLNQCDLKYLDNEHRLNIALYTLVASWNLARSRRLFWIMATDLGLYSLRHRVTDTGIPITNLRRWRASFKFHTKLWIHAPQNVQLRYLRIVTSKRGTQVSSNCSGSSLRWPFSTNQPIVFSLSLSWPQEVDPTVALCVIYFEGMKFRNNAITVWQIRVHGQTCSIYVPHLIK